MEITSEYSQAMSWANELGLPGKVAGTWIPKSGFKFATKNIDGSVALTRDGFGLGIGAMPVIEDSWERFALSRLVPKEETLKFELINRWNPYFIETNKVKNAGVVKKISDDGIKKFLDENAPNSSTYPGNSEIQFWGGVMISDKLVAIGCLAKWESGNFVISSIATKESERGKGYGKLVTEGIVALAGELNISEVFLAVNAKNEVAARVYERIGFKSLGNFNTFQR